MLLLCSGHTIICIQLIQNNLRRILHINSSFRGYIQRIIPFFLAISWPVYTCFLENLPSVVKATIGEIWVNPYNS